MILSVLMFVASSYANEAKPMKSRPCKEVASACEAAGFKKGGHREKKGLYVDCVRKLEMGESVEGVSVSSDLVEACKARREKRKERKASPAKANSEEITS
jgi:hypothetical protein